jgi:hypothetical protein
MLRATARPPDGLHVACETKEHAVVDRSRSPGFGVTLFQQSNC